MLKSVKMVTHNGTVSFPEEIKEAFLETGGLDFRLRPYASAEEIWDFMTREAPVRFPYYYTSSPYTAAVYKFPDYVECLWTLKFHYMLMSYRDRFLAAHEKGIPIVFIQGGQGMEPYHAARCIALRPFSVMLWGGSVSAKEGISLREKAVSDMQIEEQGRREISPESCHLINGHQWIKQGFVPVSLIAPYLCTRCSDTPYLAESHRSSDRKTPVLMVDFPVNSQPDQDWPVEYIAESLHRLVDKLAEAGGRKPTDEELRQSIKLMNQGRKYVRDYVEVWRSAPLIPSYSNDFGWLSRFSGEYFGEPEAGVQLARQAYAEVKERIDRGIKGIEVSEDPVRLFICGSCYTPQADRIDRAGGAVVGYDDFWNRATIDVSEEGDPYVNLARAMLAWPYERPTVERARWTVEQIIKSRANGLIFAYHWGCQLQSAVSRMIAEIVKKETGIPILYLELDQLGKTQTVEQSENRIESFIEMLSVNKK